MTSRVYLSSLYSSHVSCSTHSSTTLLTPAVLSGSTRRFRPGRLVPMRLGSHHNAACTFRSSRPQCTTVPPVPVVSVPTLQVVGECVTYTSSHCIKT